MLEALEASSPAAFLRTSFYLYPILNALHILALGALVTSAIVMDLRVLGLWRSVPFQTVMSLLRPIAIAALIVAVITGGLLFSVRPLEYVANPAFRLKLILFTAALLNAAAFQFWPRRPLAALSILLGPPSPFPAASSASCSNQFVSYRAGNTEFPRLSVDCDCPGL